jgi:hypothetical protein
MEFSIPFPKWLAVEFFSIIYDEGVWYAISTDYEFPQKVPYVLHLDGS